MTLWNLFFLLATAWADEAPSVYEQALDESRRTPSASGPSALEGPSMMIRVRESYETPRIRSFDWNLEASFESFRLAGATPDGGLGSNELSEAGAFPMVSVRSGVFLPVSARLQAGARLFAGFARREYDLTTPTGVELAPRLNALTYGAGLLLRSRLIGGLFGEMSYEEGIFQLRQSSTQSSLARWSEDSRTRALRLALGYRFANDWEWAVGSQNRSLSGSRFALSSSGLIFSTGVLW